MKGTVHCDSCHAEFTTERVQKFHRAACAICGEGPLVSDDDKAIADGIDALIEAGLASQEQDAKGMLLTVDTSELREKQE